MKKITFYSLILSVLFIGCTDDNPTVAERQASEIKMNASVAKTTLRSGPINDTFSTNFKIGVYAYNTAWKAGSSANVINNDIATVAGAIGHAIAFADGPYYYPSDGTAVNFFAFSPQAISEKTAATAGGSPVVTFNITGQQDIMWATSTGSKSGSSAATHPSMNFQHKLTQLQFLFKSDTTYPASGNSVVSLKIKNQSTVVDMIVGTGVCTFSNPLSDFEAIQATSLPAGVGITTAGTNANSPIMTNIATSYAFDIVVKPAGGGSNVTYTDVPLTLTTVVGSAHLVTFTFTGTAVTSSATVAAWAAGTGGSVSVL